MGKSKHVEGILLSFMAILIIASVGFNSALLTAPVPSDNVELAAPVLMLLGVGIGYLYVRDKRRGLY